MKELSQDSKTMCPTYKGFKLPPLGLPWNGKRKLSNGLEAQIYFELGAQTVTYGDERKVFYSVHKAIDFYRAL